MGAIVDQTQWDTIDGWVKTGVAEGGELFQPDIELPGKGCFYPPTLITGLEPASATVQEEIFGPVLVSLTFRNPAEAIALANNTRYGLAASVWSENINLALDVASKIKAGSVWVNCTNLFDARVGIRRLPRERLWAGRRQGGAVRVPAPGVAGATAPATGAARDADRQIQLGRAHPGRDRCSRDRA